MEQKDLYEEPSLEIVFIDDNVITTSGDESLGPGDNGTDFDDSDW